MQDCGIRRLFASLYVSQNRLIQHGVKEEESTASRSSRPGIEVYHLPQGYHRQVEWGYKSV